MNESLNFEDKLKLEYWGLPSCIQMMYEKRGIRKMFPWQVECLCMEGVLDGKNLIYSAPTSAGKTLVAEILCLQCVLEKKKKAIIILPFVSVVREKVFYFQDIVSESGIRVEGFMGSYHPPGGFQAVNIAICTIEKANNLINRLMEEEELSEIGCVVVDELHMLGDPHRGYLLELLLTKLKYISTRQNGLNIQIVGMSATLPNLDVVASWLNATLYKTDFRPIPLKEFLKVEKELYSTTDGYLENIQPYFNIKNDPGDVIYLCIDTIMLGYSILVFCPTKNWCETLAQQISSEIRRLGSDNTSEISLSLRRQLNSEGISDLLERLKRCPVGLDPNLGRSVAFGVAFHHAGLTLDERDIVEGGFKENLIRVLVATTTLSSGVNLPARRVLIRSPLFNSRPLNILTYKQMVGRAGRMGRDTEGESYLICSEGERDYGRSLISSDLPPISSCLASTDLSHSLTRAIIEVIASGVAKNRKEVEQYVSCTLVHACDPTSLEIPLASCLTYLDIHEFTRSLPDASLAPSPLALATLSASLHPCQAVQLLQELKKASSSFILNNHLHAIYQVTPFSVSDQWSVDWMKMFHAWETLNPDLKAVGYLVGVEDSFLVKAMRTNVDTKRYADKLSIHRRFYTALALQDLINEAPLNSIIDTYNCNKGMLQSLQQSASTFAGMVTKFCKRLGWTGLEAVLEHLSSRIEYGAQKDLLDLLKLDCFSVQIARALFSSGIKTVTELASSSSLTVLSALTKIIPFQNEPTSSKEKNSKCIWVTGKAGFTEAEAAQYFIERARKFIKKEMGVLKVDWNDEEPKEKELDSIYLNSTVNPDDLSKVLSESNRKYSFPCNLEPINNSTPVSLSNNKKCSVKSTSKSKVCQIKLADRIDVENNIASKSKVNENSKVDVEISDLQTDNHQIHLHTKEDNDNSVLTHVELSSFRALTESFTKTTPTLSIRSKRELEKQSRLSDGDLFESFDDAILISSNIIPSDSEDHNSKTIEVNSKKLLDEVKSKTDIADQGDTGIMKEKLAENSSTCEFASKNKIITDCKEMDNCIYSHNENHKTRNSLDAFFDSFSFNNDSFSQALVAACEDQGRALDELDCNWGGESLLDTSLILKNMSKKISPVSLKRKLSMGDEFGSEKKRKISPRNLLSTYSPREMDHNTLISVPLLVDNEREDKVGTEEDYKLMTDQKNQKKFQKNIKRSKAINKLTNPTTSTQLYPMAENGVKNFAPCSEISAINKIEFENTKSDSDDSIIESPEILKVPSSNTNKKTSSKLPILKNVKINKALSSCAKESSLVKPALINGVVDKGLTQSFLETAFGESFNAAECKLIKVSKEKNTKLVKMKSDSSINYISSKKYLLSKNTEAPAVKDLKSISSKDCLNLDSQDVFMTPTRESEESVPANNVLMTPPKYKIKTALYSPGKHFHLQKIKESSVSPRQEKKEVAVQSPSKYDKLNVEIIKTPEKSTNNGAAISPQNKSPTKMCYRKNSCSNEENGLELNNKFKSDQYNEISDQNNTPSEINLLVINESLHRVNKINGSTNAQKCQFLPENDKCTNPSLIFPCQSKNFGSLLDILSKSINVAVSFNVSAIHDKKSKIGSKIRKQSITEEGIKKFIHEDISLDGISLFFGNYVYYIDLLCQSGLCYDVVTYLFTSCDISLYLLDTREKLKILHYCCGIRVECKLFDPLIADWLIDSQNKIKSLSEMMKDHVENFKFTSLNHNASIDEVILVWHLCSSIEKKLSLKCLSHHFCNVEMPLAQMLVYMELSGIGFSVNYGQELIKNVSKYMKEIEEKAQILTKRTFSLSSCTDLTKVKKLLNITRENEKNHPLMGLVKDWRKLNSLKIRNLNALMIDPKERLHPVSDTRTATGRITLYEPDLQHIPRDFTANDVNFSPRSCFIPMEGNLFVGADYCQLELRLLAHFSKDAALLSSFKSKTDVFKDIAAKWNHVPVDKVDDEMRHRAKQICYGIIYGMGQTALGEHLGVSPLEASELQAEFKRCYPGIKTFIQATVSECRQNGFVKTLTGRTRHIPHINSPNVALSKQGERQAVNSKIQGSASDIAKLALVKIESALMELIPERTKVINDECCCHLVLHLHDEFIYEVSPKYLSLLISVVKSTMEEAAELLIPLPVKVRSGKSWGLLESVL